ncbi:MAG: tyrosine-type recombinase/integrase, partial [Streptomyces sp.]|uniref:tyrosine-type recombinase/integrase n=1 Tax=Streptomyces sp. TaxID=1931 RepID=UPI003D6A8978
VQAWLNGLQRTVSSPGYIGSILQTLSSVLNAAVDDELIRKNPSRARSVKPPRKVRPRVQPWSAERVAAVIDALPGRVASMALLGAGAGLRQGEIFGLAVEDIDFLQGTVRVERQVKEIGRSPVYAPPKGGRTREVPLAPEVGAALSAHLKAYAAHEVSLPWRTLDGKPEAHRLLFTTTQHRQHSRSVFNQGTWKPALAEAEVIPPPVRTEKGVRYASSREDGMHALRHFYASVLLDAGENVRALADYLGHSDPGLTLRVYAHLMPEAADRTRKAVDAALGGVVNEVIYGPSAPAVPRQAR